MDRRRYGTVARRYGTVAAPAGIAAAVVWLGFHAGGFFAGSTGLAVVALGVVFVLWLTIARRPFAAFSTPLALAVGALALFSVLVLASQAWSNAAARALSEFDRAVLYVLVVMLAGLIATTRARRTTLLRAITAGLTVVCVCGLITRLLPDLWPVTATIHPDRLSYPVTYWNTLGMMGALALVACLHLACTRQPAAIRALAAAAIPLLAATTFYTFSRGAIAVLPIGLIVYLVLGRPERMASALLAAVPTTAVGMVVAGTADAVVKGAQPITDAAVAQGKDVALVLALCAAASAVLVLALGPLDARVVALARRAVHGRRRLVASLAAGVVLLVVIGGVAAGAPHRLSEQVDRFQSGDVVDESDPRARLTDLGNNGRIDHWSVALHAFARQPIVGEGAGTYALIWARDRPITLDVNDGHSLLIEVLSELGIVGAILLVVALGSLLVGGAIRIRGPDRALAAAAFALLLMWAIRAQIDWDWEMPALTAPVLAVAGAAVGRTRVAADRVPSEVWPGRVPRMLGGIAVLVLLVTPAGFVRSQGELDAAIRYLDADRCPDAVRAALKSNSALSIRPEPFEVLGLCDARLGRGDLALAAIAAAVQRDPHDWSLRYEQAIVRASQGLDPRPELRHARRLNPRSSLVSSALKRFDTDRPALWRRRALTAPLPI